MFKNVVRNDPSAVHIPYKTLESAMYRARREIEPFIPKCATEFVNLLYHLILVYTIKVKYK